MGGPGSGGIKGDGRRTGKLPNPSRAIAQAFDPQRLSPAQRDLLVEHIDRAVGVYRSNASMVHVATSLIRLGLLRPEVPSLRPKYTVLTDLGRGTVANLLATYADALVRAGCMQERETPLQILRRLRVARSGRGAVAKCTTEAESLVHFSTPGAWTTPE